MICPTMHFVRILAFAALAVSSGAIATAQGTGELGPPPGVSAVREVQAGGAQVYTCRAGSAGTYQWALVGPKAVLVNDDGSDFGTHSAGPTWTALDGSSIGADGAHPFARADRAGSVPALVLAVTSSHGNGVLTGVRFVRRSETEGGVPSPSGCDADHAGVMTASHYSAVYTFYR